MRLRSRSIASWILLAIGIIASMATAYGAYTLAGDAWNQVVDYKSPYVRQPGAADTSPTTIWEPAELQPTVDASAPVLAKRVVLVIVDGLREDVSRSQMPTLNRLRAYGSDLTLTVPQPSLSYPNWTTILSGAPQTISGVTTNWFSGRVPVPTIMDMAQLAGRRVEVVGPEDFSALFDVQKGASVSLRVWPKGGYLSGTLVDDALRIASATSPQILILHLPDLDEAGHSYGGASKQYAEVAHKIDIDLNRLVAGLQRSDTAFIVVADHGHTDSGGHGGGESSVIHVPGVFAGAGIRLGSGSGNLEQLSPTIAILAGIPVPPYASSTALHGVLATTSPTLYDADSAHHLAFDMHYVDVVAQGEGSVTPDQVTGKSMAEADAVAARARDARLAIDRDRRVALALAAFIGALLIVALVGIASWRALTAALAGAVGYYVVYDGLYFIVHRYAWSLSAFNTETYVKAFMNGRMVEAIVVGVIGVAVAAAVYPMLRTSPRGPREPGFLSGWLALAPATVLVIQATLGFQIAWYYWWYGFTVSWVLPDFRWAFKTDLDLVQMTALAGAALLGTLVTYLVGRYHPLVSRGTADRRG